MGRFRTVAFDVDSTLTAIEGVDWLAARRGTAVAAEVAALGDAYGATAAPGARELVAALPRAGIAVHLISSGLQQAIEPFADWLGLPPGRVSAVGISFDPSGGYAGWETTSLLATATGKEVVLRELAPVPPVLMVGDGITDLATRSAGTTVAAFTGFVQLHTLVLS